MNPTEVQRFKEAYSRYTSGNYLQALQGFRELANESADRWDIAELHCHEVVCLVEMNAEISAARQRLEDLKKEAALLIESPSDGYEHDWKTALPVMVQYAEIRVVMGEEKTDEALRLLDGLESRYPKQLSVPEFRLLSQELGLLRGILLSDLGRWEEAQAPLESARAFIESTDIPKIWTRVRNYYLGRCYYELKKYKPAKQQLLEALSHNLSRSWENQAHYTLGLVEYHLSNMKAAKLQFELCARTADEEYTDFANLWAWLETTSKALGQFDEAERYHSLMIGSMPKKVN
jgi:tetratricopeptide (TPR) repeat protein